jgi:hypothetical protein
MNRTEKRTKSVKLGPIWKASGWQTHGLAMYRKSLGYLRISYHVKDQGTKMNGAKKYFFLEKL